MREWIRRSTGIAVLASILATSVLAFAGTDLFLKLDGIKGESADARHAGEIEVLSWSWGASQGGGSAAGAGARVSKANIDQFVVQKHVDAASPLLVQHLLKGQTIQSATFVVRSQGGAPQEFIKITLQNVSIAEVKASGASSANRPTETVAFNFNKVKYEYVAQDKSGKAGKAVAVEWDIAAGK